MTIPENILDNARLAAAAGDVSGAAGICRNILEADPSHIGALTLLSDIAELAGQEELARRFLTQLLRAHPKNDDCWGRLARHLDETEGGGDIVELISPSTPGDGARYSLHRQSTEVASTARTHPSLVPAASPASFSNRATYAIWAEDVTVTENFLPLLQGRRVLSEGASLFSLRLATASVAPTVYPEIKALSGGRIWLQSAAPAREISGSALLLSGGPVGRDNYFHWLIDYLPRLWALKVDGVPNDIPLIVNDDLSDVQRDTLSQLGIDPSRLILKRDNETLHCEQLVIPSFLVETGRMSVAVVAFLRRFLAGKGPGTGNGKEASGSRLVYISRRFAGRRRLVNEDAVEQMLSERGFEVVVAENLSFEDQVALFATARMVAGPHGGGFANIVFAPSTANVLEIATKPHTALASLAAAGGQPYWSLQANPAGGDIPENVDTAAYEVNLADLARLVDHVVQQLPR